MKRPVPLNRRERIAVCAVLILVGLIAIAEWGVFPIMNHRQSLEQAILTRSLELSEIEGLKKTHEKLQQNTEQTRNSLARRDKGFTLFSYLDRSAGSAGVKDHIAYLKPMGKELQVGDFKVFQVEMKLQSISLHQLSAFLYDVETADGLVRIQKASIIRTGQNAEGIDVVLWVETLAQ
jgi:general secretion pathway protein M